MTQTNRDTMRRLIRTSALVGTLFAFSGVARAQDLPSVANAGGTTITSSLDGDGNTVGLNVNLNNASRIVEWNSFNIGSAKSVNFDAGGPTARAVLNRVSAAGGVSDIQGSLTSGANVAVWIYNPNGILIGNGANINVGGLVLTALDVTDDFLTAGPHNLASDAGSTAKIQIGAGASVITSGNAGLVMVAPQIDAAGATGTTINGGTGEVAFVAATDVDLQYGFGSPLGITINKGTAFNGTSVVGGTVNGKNVYFAIASQAAVTDALLQVDAGATAASTSNQGIILLGGQSSVAGSGVTIATGAGTDTAGAAGLAVNGALTSGNKVAAATTGALTIAGGVTAETSYAASGSSVTLGRAATTSVQQAKGTVAITATGGDITGLGSLTLRSNSDNTTGVGAETLTLDVTGGGINFAAGTALQGGSNKQSDVQINADVIGSGLTLGNVTARNLLNAVGGVAADIQRTGTVTLGDVNLAGGLSVTSDTGDVAVGSITVTDPTATIILTSTAGAISSPALANLSAPGDIELSAAAALGIGGASSSTGHVSINGGGNVATGALGAGTTIDLVAGGTAQVAGLSTTLGNATVAATGTATVNGTVGVTGDYSVTGADVSLGGAQAASGAVAIESTSGDVNALSGLTLTANTDIAGAELLSIKTAAGLALGGSTLNNTSGTVRFITPTNASAFVIGNVNAVQMNQQIAAGPVTNITRAGAIATGNLNLGSALSLDSGAALITGTVSSTGGITLAGATVDAVSAQSGSGPIGITANTGDLAVGLVDSGGTATLRTLGATGDVRVDTVTAANTVTVSSVGGIRGNSGTRADLTANGGNLDVTAANSASAMLGIAKAANNLSVTAGSIDVLTPSTNGGTLTLTATTGGLTIGTISNNAGLTLSSNADLSVGAASSGSGAISLTSVNGNATVGDITAATNILVQANNGTASVTGNVTATGGNYTVSGQTVTLGVSPGTKTQQAAGAITITATSGPITGGTGLTLFGNTNDTGAEDVTFNLAAAGVDFTGATIRGGASRSSRIYFRYADNTAPVRLGNVSGSMFGSFVASIDRVNSIGGVTGIFSTGDIDFSNAVFIQNATITTGAITAPSVSFSTSNAITVNGAITANAVGLSSTGTGTVTAQDITATSGAITVTGGTTTLGTLNAVTGSISATASSGALTLTGAVAPGAASTITLNGASGVTASTLTAGGNIGVTSASGTVAIADNVTGGGNYTVSGAAVNLGVDGDAETQQAAGAITITATSGLITGGPGLTLYGNNNDTGAEDVTFNLSPVGIDFGGAAIRGGTNKTSRIFFGTTSAATPVTLGNVTAASFGSSAISSELYLPSAPIVLGDLDMMSAAVEGASVSTGAISGGGGSFFGFAALGGDLSVNGPVNITNQLITLTSGGATSFGGPVTASDLSISILGTPGTLTGGDFTATAGNIGINGTTIAVGNLSASGSIALNGVSGNVAAADMVAGTNITVTAAGAATLAGNVTAGGNYRVTGATVALGDDADAETQKAAGLVDITSTGGTITGGAGLTLQSNSDGVGSEYLVLDSAGDIAFDPTSTLLGGTAGQSNVGLRFGATGTLTLGGVTALGLTGVDAGRTTFGQLVVPGNVTAGGPLTLVNGLDLVSNTGGITLDAVTVSGAGQGITIKTLSGGSIATGALSAPGVVTLDTSGNGNASTIAANGIAVTAGTVNLGNVSTPGSITLTATSGDVQVGTANAGTSATLTASQAINFTTLTTGTDATLTAGTDITGDTATIGNTLSINAGGTTTITNSTASGLAITADVINLPTTNVTGGLSLTSTVGGITLATGSAGTTATMNAATTLDIAGPFTTGGDMTLTANGAATVDTLSSTSGAVSLTAGSVHATSVGAAGTLLVKSTAGDVAVTGALQAGGLLTVTSSNDATLATAQSTGGDVAITAGGALVADSLTSNAGAVGATAASMSVGTVGAGSSFALATTGGALTIGGADAGTTGTLNAAGPLSVTDHVHTGGDVTATATGAATIADIASTSGAVAITGGSVDVTTAQAGTTLTAGSTAGNLSLGTGGAGSALSLTATGGGLTLGSGTAGTTAQLGATGDVTIDTALDSGGNATISAGGDARLASIAATNGSVGVTAAGAVTGTGGGRANLSAGGAGNGVTVAGGTQVLLGTVTAPGEVKVTAATIDATTAQSTAGALTLNATGGPLTVGTAGSGTTTTLSTTGALNVATLQSGGAATATAGGAATLGTATAGGDLQVTAATIDATTARSTAGALTLNATGGPLTVGTAGSGTTTTLSTTGALNVATLQSGGAATATAGGAATLGTATSGGDLKVTAAGITAGTSNVTGALTLTSTGDIALNQATVGGAATLDATGRATLGAVTAGPSLSVKASDATLSGALKATQVSLTNRGTGTLRLGEGAGADGFQLSQAEINLIDADKLALDGGTGPVAIGTLTFGANSGRTNVDVLTTGAMAISNTVTGSGSARLFRFGGTTSDDTAQASEIRIVATADAGGRLLFGDAGLDLRGAKIVLGQTRFVDAVMGTSPEAVPGLFVGNPNSSLYNAALLGEQYNPANQVTLAARSLTVRYTDFALFQNTAAAGGTAGSQLGGTPDAPVSEALALKGPGAATPNSFALFGAINGATGNAAAILGGTVIVIQDINLPNSRVNGCIIGSGAGCLTTTLTQPSLNVFDSSRLDVFKSADDFSLPFDPVVGSNNEALFAGISAIDAPINPGCPGSPSGSCPPPEEK